MATNFPTTLDDATTLPAEAAGTVLATNHVIAHQNLQDSMEVVQAKIGIDSSAVTTSHDYKLSEVTSSDLAVSKTATQTLTNKTLTAPVITSPVLTVGSDATGDIYYRSAGGFTRLAKGTDTQILKLASGIPAWDDEVTTVDADATTKGLVEIATSAEITAGTATGGTGASVAVTPDQLALSTPVFNGSGLTNIRVFKNGTTTKDASDASGTQNIAHGLGRTPKKIRIKAISEALGSTGDSIPALSETVYNGTTQSSVSMYANGVSFASGAAIIDATFTLNIAGASGTQTGVVTFNGTNIIIAWTKTNSPTGSYTLLWEAEG